MKIVSMFNKKEQLISHCLTREHTTFITQNEYYKDLSRLNRDLVLLDISFDIEYYLYCGQYTFSLLL